MGVLVEELKLMMAEIEPEKWNVGNYLPNDFLPLQFTEATCNQYTQLLKKFLNIVDVGV